MKKMIAIIIMISLMPSLTIFATPPIMPGTFDVIFSSCNDHLGDENVYFDLLIRPEDYLSDELIDTDQVIISYQNKFPSYQDYDFLIQGEYISYSAYIYPLFNQSSDGCTFHLETALNDTAEFYFIVFQDDGTVLYQEMFLINDLGYGEDFKHYTSIVYDVDTHSAHLDTERVMTIGEIFLLIILGIILFVIILISVPIMILIKHRRRA